jgi:hypothetical protein
MVETADEAGEAVVEVEVVVVAAVVTVVEVVEMEVEAVPLLLLGRRSGMQSSEVVRKVVSTSREE